jgi:ParB family chromosome partitioning protein
MARKIQFDVTDEDANPAQSAVSAHSEPASRAPSLSGMAKSLQAASVAAIREIDTRLIDDSQFKDRIRTDDEEVIELAASIRAQGQLIPILVSPTSGGRFRIVYGRRRLAALRHLGLAAKALVRELDEDQAVIAQGQENSFRKDLSWIEKAVFANYSTLASPTSLFAML